MMKKVISTEKAPSAIGPYSQAVQAGEFLFVSGQIPINPASGNIEETDIAGQTHQVFHNIQAILEEAGMGFDHVVKAVCFLKDMGDFAAVNEIYAQYFQGCAYPARCAVEAARLPKDVLIEIEVTAYQKAAE